MSTIRVVNLQHTDATEPNIVLQSDGTSVFASGITISGTTTLTVSGTAEFASGTAAAPKITFIDDNDTGIYSPAANNLGITTNGTAALTIDASQQVGIGTTSPQDALHIAVPSAVLRLEDTDTNHISTIQSTAAALVLSADATNSVASSYLGLSVDGSERVRIDSSGRVGIGTTSPYSVSATGNSLNIANASSSAEINFLSSTTGFNALYFGDGTTGTDRYRGYLEYAHNGDYMRFATGTVERMRIDSSGNVGIGTTGPGTKLEVGGSAALRTDADVRLTLGSAGSIGSNNSNFIRAATDQIIYNSATSSGRHSFEIAGSEKLRIDSSGRLLVGTSSQTGIDLFTVEGHATDGTSAAFMMLRRGSANPSGGLGYIRFADSNNSVGVQIEAHTDGTWASNDYPTRLSFYTTADGASSPTERMRITNDGTIQLRNSPGIDFSQIQTNAAGMTSETLDSYEEGTWSPTLSSGTASVFHARYTKIGRKVLLSAILTSFSDRTTAANVNISNLPFTPYSSASQTGGSAFGRYINDNFTVSYVSSTVINFYSMSSGDWSAMQYNDLTNAGAQLYFHAIYDVV